MKNKLIVLYGPTAVGKTEFSFLINQIKPIEIINGDVGQFYEPLFIGTAKPDWKNSLIPHHLFDYCKEPKDITVVEYRELVIEKMNDICARGKLPVLVGGSGFYLKSLFFPPKNIEKPKKVLLHYQNFSSQELWNQLYQKDPLRAHDINSQDRYRLERALNLIDLGLKPSEQVPEYVPFPAEVLFIALTRDREDLYQRINQRTEIMFQEGWIEEVQRIISLDSQNSPWVSFLLRKKIIGYDDIIQYLKNDFMTKEFLLTIIQQKTRRYAKRQLTFLRMFEKLMLASFKKPSQWITISDDYKNRIINEVVLFLNSFK